MSRASRNGNYNIISIVRDYLVCFDMGGGRKTQKNEFRARFSPFIAHSDVLRIQDFFSFHYFIERTLCTFQTFRREYVLGLYKILFRSKRTSFSYFHTHKFFRKSLITILSKYLCTLVSCIGLIVSYLPDCRVTLA